MAKVKSQRERSSKEVTLKKAYGNNKKGDKITINLSIESKLKKAEII